MDRELRRRVVFAETLKRRLDELGITARSGAERCGMSKATIYRYLSGERLPDVSELGKMADKLGLRVEEFIYMDNDDLSWDEVFEEFKNTMFKLNPKMAEYYIENRYTIESRRPRIIKVKELETDRVYLYNHGTGEVVRLDPKSYKKWLKDHEI